MSATAVLKIFEYIFISTLEFFLDMRDNFEKYDHNLVTELNAK